jgi:hypothetical protein
MFQDTSLHEYVKTNSTLSIESFVVAEWNLNDLQNIKNYGNYRYRPTSNILKYNTLPNTYDSFDIGDYYSDALESSTISQFLVDNDDSSLFFPTPEKNRELLFSLKECFQPFRPRSGINKVNWFSNKYIDNIRSGKRPRYYMASRFDEFKYWSSYRKEDGVERGISSTIDTNNIGYAIEDASPFVIYNSAVNANRIVVKLQTNLAETARDNIRTQGDQTITDPLADRTKSSIPKRWSIQYLDELDNWVTASTFNEDSVRRDDSPIVKYDGYVEVYYGLRIPEEYKEQFNFVDYLSASTQLPNTTMNGESYIVGESTTSAGELYTWNSDDDEWESSTPEYGFSLLEDNDTKRIGLIKDLTEPKYFTIDGITTYRDFTKIKGLRVYVETMNGPNTSFDLIEMSPRLKSDITNYVANFEISKSLANDSTGLPVGGLLASNGSLTIMNHDSAFSENNTDSIIANYLKPNTKFDFYETILDVDGYDKFIPLKTFYAEDFPKAIGGVTDITITLRDFFFRLETMKCPTLFLQNVTLTTAAAILLDNIGFSNYVFKTINTSNDPIIPYFFVEPDATVAEVLDRIAISTQTAMFFDENNDFVIMSKEYLLPVEGARETNWELFGQSDSDNLVNISNIESAEINIINSGNINYTTRYIQRSPASFAQAQYFDEDRTYIYKPVLLWEVAADQAQKTINEKAKSSGGYALGAAALNTTLTASVPFVSNGVVINNIIDLGENVYWLPRFQGYLYSNGEIIRYDAIEYAISGIQKQLIQSNQEYQKYFSTLPFNGKMYPTGNVRIYSEPYYQVLDEGTVSERVIFKNGEVKSHGRGQFATDVATHHAGLSDYWSDNLYVKGINTESEYLFTTSPIYGNAEYYAYNLTSGSVTTSASVVFPQFSSGSLVVGDTIIPSSLIGDANTIAEQSTRNGIVANFNRETIPSDDIVKTLKTTNAATVQSSAFVFAGPNPMPSGITSRNLMSYVYKELDSDYTHFGTRMRIVGKKGATTGTQSPVNATEYYSVISNTNEQSNLAGGSGGIGIMVNPEKNYGYFFEIMSLTTDTLERFTTTNPTTGASSEIHNVVFYKVVPGIETSSLDDQGAVVYNTSNITAIPKKLWGGTAKILVDEGRFVGQDRLTSQTNPTVYDLAVEYEDIGNIRRFYLYLNNTMISIVDDVDPLPNYKNIALFTRGSSKCMFENIYGIKNVYAKNTGTTVVQNDSKIFEDSDITANEVMRKYSVSGFVKSSYLSGINSDSVPKHKIYFEEFGSIMRECAYFNIKYDQAYPAFIAAIAPTISKEKSYTISGFKAGSYGAEFLIFNNTDKLMLLDENTGNYLRIFGITFTQSTSNVLSVDDYFRERSNLSDPIVVDNTIYSPQRADKIYQDIKLSRSKYGKREFALDSPYIQTEDSATNLMSWIIGKTLKPRKKIAIESFGTQHLQLGDIVTIDYELPDGYKFVNEETQFVVSEISYSKGPEGPTNIIKVVEV